MALKKSITLTSNFGDEVVFPNAYIKVAELKGDKNLMSVEVFYFKEQGDKYLQKMQTSFVPSLEGNNFIAQAYEHLKTLPEFADATDC